MTYTDGTHLVADTIDELHQFASRIGLKRNWFQGESRGHPHYDLLGSMKQKAITAGAKVVRPRQALEKSKQMNISK